MQTQPHLCWLFDPPQPFFACVCVWWWVGWGGGVTGEKRSTKQGGEYFATSYLTRSEDPY